VAGALRTAVGDAGLPVRLGGDEFAVVLTGDADSEAVAERILACFAGPMSEHQLLVRASIGIADAPAGTSLDHLLRDADAAMYAAKQRGKANWVRYHHGMEQPVLAHAQLGGELRRALDAGACCAPSRPRSSSWTSRSSRASSSTSRAPRPRKPGRRWPALSSSWPARSAWTRSPRASRTRRRRSG
jgi:hypothetical protein